MFFVVVLLCEKLEKTTAHLYFFFLKEEATDKMVNKLKAGGWAASGL